ncbi:hypothetical protein MTO96_007977 [Rhipicephalus appendiculatus]
MVSCSRLCLFIWRRLLLQTLWRHYALLAIELVFVVATFMYMLYHDRVDKAQVKKLNRSYIDLAELKSMNVEYLRLRLPRGLTVIYGPGNEYSDQVVNTIFKLIGRVPTRSEVHPEPTPDNAGVTPIDYVQRHERGASVPASCREASSKLLRRSTFAHTVGRTMCIQFEPVARAKGLDYSLVMLVPPGDRHTGRSTLRRARTVRRPFDNCRKRRGGDDFGWVLLHVPKHIPSHLLDGTIEA